MQPTSSKQVFIRYLLIFFLLSTVNNILLGQSFPVVPRSKLLYYINADSTNSNQFLFPVIENELKKLKSSITNDSNSYIFDSVRYLNVYLSLPKINKNRISLIRLFRNDLTVLNSDEGKKRDSIIASNLNNNNFFLLININILDRLLEYQFLIFKLDSVKEGLERKIIRDMNVQEYRATSVFIDPSLNDYKEKIRLALRQLIYEANIPPKPQVIYNNNEIDSIFFIEKGSKLKFIASQIDEDSPPDQMKYTWALVDSNKKQSLSINPNIKEQIFDFKKEGDYILYLSVSDGNQTRKQEYILKVISKPYISSRAPDSNIYFEDNTFHLYSYRKKYNEQDFSKDLFNISNMNVKVSVGVPTRDTANITLKLMQPKSQLYDTSFMSSEITLPKIPTRQQGISNEYVSPYTILKTGSTTFSRFNDSTNYTGVIFELIPSAFTKGNTIIPSTKVFKVTVDDHGVTNSDYFKITYHRVSFINPLVQASFISTQNSTIFGGAGFSLFLRPLVTLYSIIGISYPVNDLNFSPSFKDGLTYKFELDGFFIKSSTIELALNLNFLSSPNYTDNNLTDVVHEQRLGFGAAFQKFSKIGIFKLEQLGLPQFFFTIYPKNSILSKLNSSAYEIGARINYFLIR
ncbi:MAG TPA: hypothetical protein VFW07_06245 [Parafilimonas sp.]|nr:hypothetical protein [Parafilimonas sp.]